MVCLQSPTEQGFVSACLACCLGKERGPWQQLQLQALPVIASCCHVA